MRFFKRSIVWLVLMTVTAFCVNLAGTAVVKIFLANTLTPSMMGYSQKGETLLHPTYREPTEEKKSNGLGGLVVRSLLDNARIVDGTNFIATFAFLNDTVDQTVIFLEKNGSSPLYRGSFEAVYTDTGEKTAYMRSTVGAISVNEFCKNDCAKDVYELLKKTPNAVIRVDSYSISDYAVSPASLTVFDENGNEVGQFDCKSSGDIITADNVYVHNSNKSSDETDMCSFCADMKVVYLGERRSDRAADKLAEKVSFDGATEYSKTSYGFGRLTTKMYEVSGDYAMVTVLDFSFISGVLLYIAIAAVPITLLTFLVGRKKKEL